MKTILRSPVGLVLALVGAASAACGPANDAAPPPGSAGSGGSGGASTGGSGVTVAEVNQLVDRFFDARKMMSQMAGQMGMPFGRKNTRKAGKGKNKQAGKKKGGRGPTPAKNRNPLGAGMPAGFPDLSNMPKGLDELPPGLAGIDLSKMKFPKN